MSRIPKKVATFVIGSACSGKSTLAGYLARTGHGVTFRSGAFMEEYVRVNCPGKTIKDFIGTDHLAHIPDVDDAVLLLDGIMELMAKEERVIVDGYPRGLHQMYTFTDRFKEMLGLGHVIRIVNLVVPERELLRRMHKRNRHTDTEARILAENSLHYQIARMMERLANINNGVSFLEMIVPDGADEATVKRDFTPEMTGKLTEIPLMDSICRRISHVFNDMEFRRHEGFSKASTQIVHL